ncbi:ArsR/SmtB family transcription factor [Nocardia arizonensis]|uniref:ArsR/SmtB family transcription factor n=1 Tax=Nocardia arizonensis TaxID=1141647 RepID=UPI0006CF33D6|nr:helix-turn-helix domain-containing protein [Nocardia arizonensis]
MSARELAELAALLSDRSRAQLCLCLLDGRAWTAVELAAAASIAPSTASEHLSRLVDGGLLVEQRRGRHRYLRLAGPRAADLLEAMLGYLGPTRPAPTLRAATSAAAHARARTCYDHLAGRLGVAIADAMRARDLLTDDFALTDAGAEWLAIQMPADAAHRSARPLTRPCPDWTERRYHLAGAAGARICAQLFTREWIRRTGSGRAVAVTPAGHTALRELLGMDTEL